MAIHLGFAAAGGATPVPEEPVRILLYHRVGDGRYPTTNVTVEAFRAQMEWLRDNGFTVVSTRDLEAHLLDGRLLPPKPVVLQFDDGYRSVLETAWPVLREFGYPFTVFLPTRALDDGYSDYLTWEEVEGLAREGVEFGVHGHRHLRLGRPRDGEASEEYRSRVRVEFARSAERFQAHGLEPRWVAYPYGEYGPAVLEACRELGFRLGFTQDPGAVPPGGDPFRIPRFAVVGSLADLGTFQERMTYGALLLRDLEPPPGPLAAADVPRFAGRLVEPERYEPGVNLFVSEAGRLDARYDAATGRFEAPGFRLTRRINRVLVSARERATGRFALASWLLVGPGTE
ncbi:MULTISPECIES: polysaccharide deacetylase family protein [Deferrisoma]